MISASSEEKGVMLHTPDGLLLVRWDDVGRVTDLLTDALIDRACRLAGEIPDVKKPAQSED